MELKKRIIALDIGTKRIGIATCDALWMSANPLKTINRSNDKIALEEIKKICQEYQTDTILIGIPYNMDGTLGFQAKNCLKFIEPLRKDYVILEQDERLSSSEAENILKNQGKKYTKNKALVDSMAASVILREYIENNR
ncbi:MAG: Holliday junction resolvase RuvX [Candidatus Gastranaerophilales bacterium]|nr:Holliday junction resolvase RuvX [Candidatus Gastranaerophilales bacterium]